MWNVAPAKRAVRPAAVALLAIFGSLCWSQASADTLRIGGTGATHALMQLLGAAFAESRPGVTFEFPPSLGSGGGVTAAPALIGRVAEAVRAAAAEGYSHALDGRFKGGYITRTYGKPGGGIHALQLELSQITYMDENPPYGFREDLAVQVRPVLHRLLEAALTWACE